MKTVALQSNEHKTQSIITRHEKKNFNENLAVRVMQANNPIKTIINISKRCIINMLEKWRHLLHRSVTTLENGPTRNATFSCRLLKFPEKSRHTRI